MTAHILVDKNLQIHTNRAKGANHNIGADTTLEWHIAIRIRQRDIPRVIEDSHTDLLFGCQRDTRTQIRRETCTLSGRANG